MHHSYTVSVVKVTKGLASCVVPNNRHQFPCITFISQGLRAVILHPQQDLRSQDSRCTE